MYETFEKFEEWFDSYLCRGLPRDIIAVNFNIYETEDPELYELQMIGSSEYDPDDPDWACSEEFTTGEDVLELEASDCEDCLMRVGGLLHEYLEVGAYAAVLSSLNALTYGFADGDLEVVFER